MTPISAPEVMRPERVNIYVPHPRSPRLTLPPPGPTEPRHRYEDFMGTLKHLPFSKVTGHLELVDLSADDEDSNSDVRKQTAPGSDAVSVGLGLSFRFR